MSNRNKLRLLSLGFLVLSFGSCVGTAVVPNRRGNADEVAWLVLFAAGLGFFLLAATSLKTSFSRRPRLRRPEVEGEFPAWAALFLGPAFGVSYWLKSEDAGLLELGIGAALGLSAGCVIWFSAYLNRLELDPAPAEDEPGA